MAHKLLIYLNLISIIAFFTISCISPKNEEFEKLENYFKNVHKAKITSEINKIIVITESNCGSCNKAFAKIVLEKFNPKNSIVLITAKGSVFDISPFIQIKENCYFDWELNTTEYPQFSNSSVIFLKNNAIDTVITLEAVKIQEQLEFFEKNL